MGGLLRKDGDEGEVGSTGSTTTTGTDTKVGEEGSDPLVDSLVETQPTTGTDAPPPDAPKKPGFFEKLKQKAEQKKVEKQVKLQAEAPDKFDAAVGEKKWSTAGSQLLVMPIAAALSKWAAATKDQRTEIGKALRTKKPSGGNVADSLKKLAQATDESEPYAVKYLFSARFHMMASRSHMDDGGTTWTKAGLMRSWDVLELLPQKNTSKNMFLKNWTRYAAASGEGFYGAVGILYSEAAMGYKDDTEIGTKVNTQDAVDSPFHGKNEFDNTCRHEVGHAVDKKIGGARRLASKSENGGWKSHGSGGKSLVKTLVSKSAGAINGLPDKAKSAVIQVLADAMDAGTTDVANPVKQALIDNGVKKTQVHTAVLADPALKTVTDNGRDKSPWYNNPDGGVIVDGRVYQESYPGKWTSYLQSARDRKVSRYQWRADGEWFAEVYATYFLPGDGPQKLAAVDPASATWFGKNVA
jgi:hypothetical protein